MGFMALDLSADLNLQVRFGGSSPTSTKQKAISIVCARNTGISTSVTYSDKKLTNQLGRHCSYTGFHS